MDSHLTVSLAVDPRPRHRRNIVDCVRTFQLLARDKVQRLIWNPLHYGNFAYSAFACCRIGISGSASNASAANYIRSRLVDCFNAKVARSRASSVLPNQTSLSFSLAKLAPTPKASNGAQTTASTDDDLTSPGSTLGTLARSWHRRSFRCHTQSTSGGAGPVESRFARRVGENCQQSPREGSGTSLSECSGDA